MELVHENTGVKGVKGQGLRASGVSADGLWMPMEQKWSKLKKTPKSGVQTQPPLSALTKKMKNRNHCAQLCPAVSVSRTRHAPSPLQT